MTTQARNEPSADLAARVVELVTITDELRAALKPFGDAFDGWEDDHPADDKFDCWEHPLSMNITRGDYRRAYELTRARSA
jgi:hypothetical protein